MGENGPTDQATATYCLSNANSIRALRLNWPRYVHRCALFAMLLSMLNNGWGTAQIVSTDDPRDIEQVWKRPDKTRSWAELFKTHTHRNDFNKSIAIVIGLSDYTNYWRPLEAPWYDARHVRDVLIKLGFDHVITLTNRRGDKDTIRKYMDEILPTSVGKDDRFLFYFSGHGTQRELFNAVRGYLPMLDSGRDNWSSMIGMDEIAKWSVNFRQARHSLFVLDSCFSGLAGEQSKGDEYLKPYMDDLLKPGHFLITAGSAGQQSYANMQKWGGSLFTAAFLDGIAGAADSGTLEFPPDGVISLTKLYDYVRKRIAAERQNIRDILQTPLISDLQPKSMGEFFFIADPAKAHPRFIGPGLQTRVDRKGPTIGGAIAPDSPSAKVDAIYGDGLKDFREWRFGRPLQELSSYKWSEMPKAGEFTRADVRYLILKIKGLLPAWDDYGCISPTSYFVFFFESEKLFRISMRFFNEGACKNHSLWLTHFANSVGAVIAESGVTRYFDVVGSRVQLLGAMTQVQTVIDLVSEDQVSLMTEAEWLRFVNGT